MSNLKLFCSYLRRQLKLILMLLLFVILFAVVFSLYNLPVESVAYASTLCLVVGFLLFAVGYARYVCRHRLLQRLRQNVEETVFSLPPPMSRLEEDYQLLLRDVCANRAQITAEHENAYQDMTNYYTLWAHQIKTPLAALSLLLQEEQPDRNALSAELLKIEEYVEMVLSYLRLGSDSTDYLLRHCDLDKIVRTSVRKYAKLFILKNINLTFDETHRTVLTDEKWLSFSIGQLLSNALKYTPEQGSIHIYAEQEALIIADNGIGIRAEDLPRVFEKGFTGYNGREQRKSTGIGLYLCRRILTKLGHEITIASQPGRGTQVRVDLNSAQQVVE